MEHDIDQQALLRAIIKNPDEDTPRLMYADWLEEHDEPYRAKFIRAQLKAATAPPKKTGGREEHELERAQSYKQQWLWEFRSRGLYGVEFRRGPARGRVGEGAELDRIAGHAQAVRSHDHVPRLHLRALDRVRHRVNQAVWHPGRLQHPRPVGCRGPAQDRFEPLVEGLGVVRARVVGREARVGG